MPISLREKKLFFLFSKLNSVNNRNVRFTLVVDYFLNNQNKSTNLIEVHSELDKKIGLNSSPESLKRDISNSDLMHYFHGFSKKQKIEKEFNLNQKLYKTLISYEENTDVLEELITEFLFKKQEDPIKYKVILEIFYEALIERNLMFLRQASSMKEIGGLTKQLQIDLKKVHSKHENADLLLYNEFILNSDKKFNDILRVLVNKVFEFMQLHYDPTLDKHNNKAFKNKIFYLDSSFIMRLFGFNDLIRRDRALELIKILKTIPNVKFVVHQETINETNNAITNIVNNAEKYINNQRALIDKIGRYSKCKLHALELFDDLKASKKISSYKEFKLYYGNVSKVLKRIFGNDFELNDEKFETPDPDVKYKDLEDEIFKFEWKLSSSINYFNFLLGNYRFLNTNALRFYCAKNCGMV